MAIRADSLKVRLFVAVAVWAVTVIVAAAILLTGLYRQTVERRFERELDLHLYNLIAVTDFNPSGGLRGQPALSCQVRQIVRRVANRYRQSRPTGYRERIAVAFR